MQVASAYVIFDTPPKSLTWTLSFDVHASELQIALGGTVTVGVRTFPTQEVYLKGKGPMIEVGYVLSGGGKVNQSDGVYVIPYNITDARDMSVSIENDEVSLKVGTTVAALFKFQNVPVFDPIKVSLLSQCGSSATFSLMNLLGDEKIPTIRSSTSCDSSSVRFDGGSLSLCAGCQEKAPNVLWEIWSRFARQTTRTKIIIVVVLLTFLLTPVVIIYKKIYPSYPTYW